MNERPGQRNTASPGGHGGRRYAGPAAGLAMALMIAVVAASELAVFAAPGLAAVPHCPDKVLRQNWIRVADLDRSLELYIGVIGLSEQTVKRRKLSKKLAKPDFVGTVVRTADLCRELGPGHALRIIEVSPEMIALPAEDQTLLMRYHVLDLAQVVEKLPEELSARGTYGTMQEALFFMFEDYDGNRIILTEESEKAE